MMAGKPPSVANYHLVRGLINPAPSREKPRQSGTGASLLICPSWRRTPPTPIRALNSVHD
jgi:hypothetical protein